MRGRWYEQHPRIGHSFAHLKDVEFAYIAGLVDGEGTIGIYWTASWTITLRIPSTSRCVIDWLLARIPGGCEHDIKKNPRHKQMWRWGISTKRSQALLPLLLPYLVIKKEAAMVALMAGEVLDKLRTERHAGDGRFGHTPREATPEFMALVAKLRALNYRGVPIADPA